MSQGFTRAYPIPLPVAMGGTGLTTVVSGDILYASGSDVLARLSKGTQDYVMTQGVAYPQWSQRINKGALPQDAVGITWDTLGILSLTQRLAGPAGAAATPGIRLGAVETGFFQDTNTLGFSQNSSRVGSVISGVWILGSGIVAGAATSGGIRVPGIAQFDSIAYFGGSADYTGTNVRLRVLGSTWASLTLSDTTTTSNRRNFDIRSDAGIVAIHSLLDDFSDYVVQDIIQFHYDGAVKFNSAGKIGFFGATPIVRVGAYTFTNTPAASRSVDFATVTLAELAALVATGFKDLGASGSGGYGLFN